MELKLKLQPVSKHPTKAAIVSASNPKRPVAATPDMEVKLDNLEPKMFEFLFKSFDLTKDELRLLTSSLLVLDSTKLDVYQTCPRKFLFSSVLGLTPPFISLDTVFGVALHDALGFMYEKGPDKLSSSWIEAQQVFINSFGPYVGIVKDSKSKNIDTALRTITNYAIRYGDLDKMYTTVGTAEAAYALDINGAVFIVKPDLIVRDTVTRKVHIMEHKSTGVLSQTWFRMNWQSMQLGAYTYYLLNSGLVPEDSVDLPMFNLIVFPVKKNPSLDDCFFRSFVGTEYKNVKQYTDFWTVRATATIDSLVKDLRSLLSEPDPDDAENPMNCFLPNVGGCYKYGQVCQYAMQCSGHCNPLHHMSGEKAEQTGSLFAIHIWNPILQFQENLKIFSGAIKAQTDKASQSESFSFDSPTVPDSFFD